MFEAEAEADEFASNPSSATTFKRLVLKIFSYAAPSIASSLIVVTLY